MSPAITVSLLFKTSAVRRFGPPGQAASRWLPRLSLAAAAAPAAGCGSIAEQPARPVPRPSYTVFEPATDGLVRWEHHVLRKGPTRYELVDTPRGPLLEAEGRESASILLRVLDQPLPAGCRRLEWSWSVERLQPDADITVKRRQRHGQ